MDNAQRKTLRAIFEVPTRDDIAFRDIEKALRALGATIAEREGSRIRVALQGEVWRCHRPHPGKEVSGRGSPRVAGKIEDCSMNSMTHKGISARIEFDDRDGIFVGRVVGVRDIIGFHGTTVTELRKACAEAIDDYLVDCKERGIKPPRPVSGKMLLRIPPELHAEAARAAELAGESLNKWATDALRRAVG